MSKPNHNIAPGLISLAVHVSHLKFDPKNARVHPDRNIEDLKTSLKTYGQRRPVVANFFTNTVIAGNGLLQAAKALGWTEVAVLWVEDDALTSLGYAIADNASGQTSFWDEDLLNDALAQLDIIDRDMIVGFTDDEIDKRLGINPLTVVDGLGGEEKAEHALESEEAGTPEFKTVTLYVPAEEYEVFMSDVDRLKAKYETTDVSTTIIKAVEVWGKQ